MRFFVRHRSDGAYRAIQKNLFLLKTPLLLKVSDVGYITADMQRIGETGTAAEFHMAQNSKKQVLFFSVGDSTRSQIAQGFFRAWADPKVEAVSTAFEADEPSVYAVEVMREIGIDISAQRPETIKESFKQHFVCVVAICEMPRERCPIWPFTVRLFKWNVPNPVKSQPVKAADGEALREIRDEIGTKVKEFIQQTLPTVVSSSTAT